MSTLTINDVRQKHPDETRNVAVSFLGCLDAGELLQGTPTVTEVDTTALTLSAKAVSSEALTIDGVAVAAAQAVTFKVAGGTAGQTYRIKVSVGTTEGQTIVRFCKLKVLAN